MLVFALLAMQCTRPEPEKTCIHFNFDHGSLGPLKEVQKNEFEGQTMHWIKSDQIGNQYYWFYFQVDNAENETLKFKLTNLQGVYRGNRHLLYTGETRPVISYDRQNWKRISDVDYDQNAYTFTFQHTFTENRAWIAYAHPYSLSRKQDYLERIADHPMVEIDTIGYSREERPVEMITIPSDGNPGKMKTLFFTGLQHPGEDCVGYLFEGLLDFILSDDPMAARIRDHYLIKLVFMMNPDGVFHGTTRYSWTMEDLNAEWDTTECFVEPEVEAVKSWAEKWMDRGNQIAMMLDFHSHGQKNTRNVLVMPEDNLSELVPDLQKYWKIMGSRGRFGSSASSYFYYVYQVPSATVELSQSHPGDGKYLTIDDYRNYGKGIMLGIRDFIEEE